MEPNIEKLIEQLKKDSTKHKNVGDIISDVEISEIEKRNKIVLPKSYKTFLQSFGDGAYWLYGSQPMDSIRNIFWLKDVHKSMPEYIPIDDGSPVLSSSLLCLMTEDSNGGSWCWLTNNSDPSGEWPIAYYSRDEEKLFYEINSFTEWIGILVDHKDEVIRTVDKDEKLDLG